ncbi:MAG: PHP domain-containing protein, partial [Bacteroidetes bacterium]|nr:PHP domain-containing protein [Bacteroidota bacterium]
MYINTHTYYSLRYGTIAPKQLLELFQRLGVRDFAVTDINTTSAAMDLLRLASKYQVSPRIGIDFRNGAQQQFIMLAKNNYGFQLMNTYLSQFLHSGENIPTLAKLIPNTFVIYPF